jgi:hypothetical protein
MNIDKIRTALATIAEAIDEIDTKPEEHWIGPFEWRGGECPLPPAVRVKITLKNGSHGHSPNGTSAHSWSWQKCYDPHSIVSFSYLADNAAGWIKRPDGWLPPEEAWNLGLRWTASELEPGYDGVRSRIKDLSFDANVKYIRLPPPGFVVSGCTFEPAAAEPKLPDGWEIRDGWLASPHCHFILSKDHVRKYGADTIRAAVEALIAETE